jgi:fibro-slime domain-containing protein
MKAPSTVRAARLLNWGILPFFLATALLSGCDLAPELSRKTENSNPDGSPASGGAPPIVDEPIEDPTGGQGGTPPDDKPEDESVCDNGKLESGELCDDGVKNGVGCSADCKSQDPEFDCSTPGEPCKDTVVCGNGVLEGDEACDDKNELSDDGCAEDCTRIEAGFVCLRPGVPCVAVPVCGNGERERGETCDDGNDDDREDGCHDCIQESGFFCVPGKSCVRLVCGDGNRTPDEECDDGPGNLGAPGTPTGGDGCSEICEVEEGWRCGQSGCHEDCGDGVIVGAEAELGRCDDGNRSGGDGCSSACKEEPFFTCSGEPSNCETSIVCGNGEIEPGEICDPPGSDGCLPGCASFSPNVAGGSVCGNGFIEGAEECDAPNPGLGCTAGCLVEPGFSCPRPNECFALPRCGDGTAHFQLNEECDDGNETPGDGCTACTVDSGYTCTGLGPSVCIQETCGDGVRTVSEECDDGNGTSTDGCNSCAVTTGWACPVAGDPCVTKCGDGIKLGFEECDDGDLENGDGCNAACRVEPGYTCDSMGCEAGECGNSTVESGEGCDSGDTVAGDGCGPTCQDEPQITRNTAQSYPDPTVAVSCGDGLVTGSEECDDGNTRAGDGCATNCTEEFGYDCTETEKLPPYVDMKVTYRDFKRDSDAEGHPDFEYGVSSTLGIAGPACTKANNTKCTDAAGSACAANTCGFLDKDGKPVLHKTGAASGRGYISNANSFGLWYRDTNTLGVVDSTSAPQDPTKVSVIPDVLRLTQSGGTGSNVYRFQSNNFFPLTGRGLGNTPGQTKNFHFTTELRYFFQYEGGETLTFLGDDDVWVFINGYLAVDIGGVHGALQGRVVLGDDGGYNNTGTDSNCSAHMASGSTTLPTCSLDAAEASTNDSDDVRFHLTRGGVYEIVLFHAERHTSESNFNLTLQGFLPPRSFCAPTCGDGETVGNEVCDDGANNKVNPASGECNSFCSARAYCGDGEAQAGEVCDNGQNRDLYLDPMQSNQCAPGCAAPPRCGDNQLESAFEECDNGSGNSNQAYGPGSCTTNCTLGGYCGDGQENGNEVCDLGPDNGQTYGAGSCSFDCKPGPRCGDGARNGSEECDAGAENGTANSGCSTSCTLEPYCGDGTVSAGEECDYGQFASDEYGGCTDECLFGPRCGDGVPNTSGGEECDEGADNDGSYGGCTDRCTLGPRCGDGQLQSGEDEECDNGFNEDTYRSFDDSCMAGCKLPPYCGDGKVDGAYELCDAGTDNDDGAYDGCSSLCEWGPYCGDGKKNGPEVCDNGANNTAYSLSGEGCGYDCKPAAYCGDGQRNGMEQCDLGTKKNTGAYGGCKKDCSRAPYCGDRIVDKSQGEECDAGPTGSFDCSVTCRDRTFFE